MLKASGRSIALYSMRMNIGIKSIRAVMLICLRQCSTNTTGPGKACANTAAPTALNTQHQLVCLEPEDKAKLKDHPANALIELQALATGQKVNDVIQPVQQIGIDPNLYEVRTIFDDVQLVGGAQEANYGGVSKATATETSIAESARMSSLGAQIDELDSFMSNVTRTAGQVLLLEMGQEQVRRICGPGAVWPELSREQIMEEVFLEIEAGSTGKPNRAAELRNIERIMPFLIQIPNIDPQWLAKELIKRLDDKLDVDEALRVNMPSVISQNQAMQPGTGGPLTTRSSREETVKTTRLFSGGWHRLTRKWIVSSGPDYEFHLQSHTRRRWNDIQPWREQVAPMGW